MTHPAVARLEALRERADDLARDLNEEWIRISDELPWRTSKPALKVHARVQVASVESHHPAARLEEAIDMLREL